MLYGHVIVIKRTGEDGSKFPVTGKIIKIGSSADCPILINTPYVSSEHCQLVVEDDGQAKLQNFSTVHPTVVNNAVVQDETPLAHGDIIEIGGRLVRWEYLDDSPFYREIQAPKNESVEVVEQEAAESEAREASPQPENSEASDAAPSTSSQVLPSTPDSTKKVIRLTPSMVAMLKGRKSLQATKALFSPLNNRRKSDAIRALSGADLQKIVVINGKSALTRTTLNSPSVNPCSSRVSSPFVDHTKRAWSMKPLLNTIGEKQQTLEANSETKVEPLPSDGPDSTSETVDEVVDESPSTPEMVIDKNITAPDEEIPSTPSSSRSVELESPVKDVPNTPNEISTVNFVCSETPPEVKTPTESSENPNPPSPIPPQPITPIPEQSQAIERPREGITPSTVPRRTFKVRRFSPFAPMVHAIFLASRPPSRPPVRSLRPRSLRTTPQTNKTPLTTLTKAKKTAVKKNTPSRAKAKATPAKSIKKTPTPVKRRVTVASAKKSASPRSVQRAEEKTPPSSKKKIETSPRKSKASVLKPARRKISIPPVNTKVAKALKIKKKIHSAPDKTKKKILILLNKAVKSKSQTEMRVRNKLLKKAIQMKNKKQDTSKGSSVSPKKSTPPKTPAIKISAPPRTPGVRSSKRINTKHELSRPDFTELSPSALGLTPRHASSKSPNKKQAGRNASMLTPQTSPTRSSRLRKRGSDSSLDFQTPEISQEIFVSPLSQSRGTPQKRCSPNTSINLMEFYTPLVKTGASPRKSVKPAPLSILEETICVEKPAPRASTSKSPKNEKKPVKSPYNVVGVKELFTKKSPRNDLRKIRSIRKLFKTPPVRRPKRQTVKRQAKSPKNDLTDVKGVKEIFHTKNSKSPNVDGVKRIFSKTPRNDLTNVHGVRDLFLNERKTQSPVIAGISELFASPSTSHDHQEVATPVVKKRNRGTGIGTPGNVDSPSRRRVSNPRTRSLRPRTSTVPDLKVDGQNAPPQRKRKEVAAKHVTSDDSVSLIEKPHPSPPKRGRKALQAATDPETPTRSTRTRKRTVELVPQTSEEDGIKKTTRPKARTASVKATPAKKKRASPKESPSPSPKKRATRATATGKASKKKAVVSPAAAASPKGRKASAKAPAKSSPSPKKRTRGARAKPVAKKSPSPLKRATRGRAATAAK